MTIAPISAANAVCGQEIYADRAYSNGTYTYLYGRPSSASTVYYYGYTTNATLAALILNAATAHNKIYIVGNASTCPTSGTCRFIGAVLYAYAPY